MTKIPLGVFPRAPVLVTVASGAERNPFLRGVHVCRSRPERGLQLEGPQLRMRRLDERRDARDVRGRVTVAGDPRAVATRPWRVDVDAAREELGGRVGVPVEVERVIAGPAG